MISKSELEYRIALGQSLKKYREMMGFTLRDVEKHLGINRGLLSNVEYGKRPINNVDIDKLAELYRTKSSFIHQSAVDRIELLGLNDPNLYLEFKMDLDGTNLIVTSKRTSKTKSYRLPESILNQLNKDFN